MAMAIGTNTKYPLLAWESNDVVLWMGDESEDLIVPPIRSLAGLVLRREATGSFHYSIPYGPNESSSLSVLIERTRVKLKVRPDLRGALREEVEQWAAEAEELQAELHTTLRVEVIVDHDFERPSEVDDLVREVKEAKEWLGSNDSVARSVEGTQGSGGCYEGARSRGGHSLEDHARAAEPIAGSPGQSATVQPVRMKRRPMFLSSEDEGENTRTPKKARKERTRSPLPEIIAVERLLPIVARVPQSVAKHGYPEHAYLLGWLIYNGHKVLKRPAKCGQCLRYGHTCSGEVGKMCGRCIRDRQGCVAAEEYVVKDEKDGRELEVKERGSKGKSKGKAKEKVDDRSVLDFVEGRPWHPNVYTGQRGENGGVVERSEELMRSVSGS
ncbi:hypothetical protein JB92DRAFT_3138455 [Gautieria morchelliformis]|nr:hypothetical protein JB92DRAFT_3138455 [Gautieria morchelliformis]